MYHPSGARLAGWLLCAFMLVAAGCDVFGSQEEDRIIEGVDLDVLFAPPTAAEKQAILDEWATRDVSAQEVEVLAVDTVDLGQEKKGIARVVRHSVGGVRHVGAIVVPEGATGPLPVLVYGHGGDGGRYFAVSVQLQ